MPPDPSLVTVRAASLETRVRLVCVPHAGAGDWIFHALARELDGAIEVLAVPGAGPLGQWPGPPESVRARADRLARQLGSLAGAPLVLFGHSLGALVAFETARRLRELGTRVAGLFVCGCGGPSDPLRTGPASLDDPDAVLRFLESLGGTPTELFAYPELRDPLLASVTADLRAAREYRREAAAPLDCPLAATGGAADAVCGRREGLDAWSRETSGAFTLAMFPGPHNFWLADPVDLAALLGDFLSPLTGPAGDPAAWARPPARPVLGDEVHLWSGRLDQPDPVVEGLAAHLDAEERERASRFRFEVDRRRFIVSHGMLRSVLARYLDLGPGAVGFRTAPGGRPGLRVPGGPEFSLSHSGGRALCALAAHPLGVDLEEEGGLEVPEELVDRHFTEAEKRTLAGVSGRRRRAMFLAGWTYREAFAKAEGTGIAGALEAATLSVDLDGPAGPAPRLAGAAGAGWSFPRVPRIPGHPAACAVRALGCTVWSYEWSPA